MTAPASQIPPAAERRTDQPGEPLLDVRDLTVTYHSGKVPVYAARGVDLTLAPGETLGHGGGVRLRQDDGGDEPAAPAARGDDGDR